MAREQWKKIGVIAGLVSLTVVVAGSIFATGGTVVAVKEGIKAVDTKIDTEIKGVNVEILGVKENASEDRESVKVLAGIVSQMKVAHNKEYEQMKDAHAADYKELKEDAHASELRDERQSTQYSQILNHMTQQTAQNKVDDVRSRKVELDMAEIKVQMKTLIPE